MADTGEAQLAQEPTELEEDPAHEDTTDLDEEVHFRTLAPTMTAFWLMVIHTTIPHYSLELCEKWIVDVGCNWA